MKHYVWIRHYSNLSYKLEYPTLAQARHAYSKIYWPLVAEAIAYTVSQED